MSESAEQTDPGVSLRVSETLEDVQWDRFVAATPGGRLVQTGYWAVVKASLGWKPIRLMVIRNDQIVAGCQILTRKYRFIGSVGYVTNGPLCSEEDPELARYLITQMTRISRERRCKLFAVQPPDNAHYMSKLLLEQGFSSSTLNLSPTASVLIDLTPEMDEILSRLKRKTRQYVNRSRRKGITIHEGDESDLDTFYSLHLHTCERQKFMPYPKSYYDTMKRVLEPHGHFKILLAKYEDLAVSGLLIIPFRETVITKIIGWSGLHGGLRPNEALYWGSIQWAKEHGYRYVDLEGIDPAVAADAQQGKPVADLISHSQDKIKYGFGGQIVLYPRAYDMVFNPIYRWFYHRLGSNVAMRSFVSKVKDFFHKQ